MRLSDLKVKFKQDITAFNIINYGTVDINEDVDLIHSIENLELKHHQRLTLKKNVLYGKSRENILK